MRLSALSPGRLFPSAFGQANPATPSTATGRCGVLGSKHLERYLLVPSSRYAAPGARKARGELTGCLLYDPPAETRWAVSQ
jgi:hypothetical protein